MGLEGICVMLVWEIGDVRSRVDRQEYGGNEGIFGRFNLRLLRMVVWGF